MGMRIFFWLPLHETVHHVSGFGRPIEKGHCVSRDFFLLNRCHQVAKICAASSSSGFQLPPVNARPKSPAKLGEFYRMLDKIIDIAGNESDIEETSSAHLDASQRQLLEDFERTIVANRFSVDEAVKQPAVALIRAIFADAAYFSGLKPLPQYTDVFAYELLFPSWLNLLKATMLPRADNQKARLEGQRQGALFEFLGDVCSSDTPDASGVLQPMQLVAFLTFVASRFDAPHCEEMLQRLVDLVLSEGQPILESLDSIDLDSKNARELRERCADYLVVRYSAQNWETSEGMPAGKYQIAYRRLARRPIPEFLTTQLGECEAAKQWSEFFALANPLRCIIQSDSSIAPQYLTTLARYPQHAGRLLPMLVCKAEESKSQILPEEAQDCLADIIAAEPGEIENNFPKLEKIAQCILPKLKGLNEAALKLFQRMLIEDATGRNLLLNCCASEAQRQSLANQILERARKADDDPRFLNLLSCLTVISPQSTADEARKSLRAIDAVVANRSIGNRELSDLVDDLRTNVHESLDLLSSPMMAAGSKNPRLAALYLTLCEVSEKLDAIGTVDNFSVVRAKYAKLTNMDFD